MSPARSKYSQGKGFHVWGFRVAAAIAVAMLGTALVVLVVDGPSNGPAVLAIMGAVAALGAWHYRTDDGSGGDDGPPDWPTNLYT